MRDADAVGGQQNGGRLERHHQDIQAQPAPEQIRRYLDETAKISLTDTEARVRRHYALLSGGRLPQLSLQLIHAPVFHGHTFSIAVEYEQPVTLEQIEATLSAPHLEVILGDADAPGNLNSIGDEDVSVRVRLDEQGVSQSRRLWLWASADNLELSALNAVECAQELRKLRPQGTVQ